LNSPQAIAISGSNLYVADFDNTVEEFNIATGNSVTSFTSPSVNAPADILIAGGDLYVSNSGNGTVGEFDTISGDAITGFNTITGFDAPDGIAFEGVAIPEPKGGALFAGSLGLLAATRRFRRSRVAKTDSF
jgi:hypothetical protein